MTENNIYKRLIAFQGKVQPVKKNAKNPFFKSNYATLDAIQFAIQKPLAEEGLGYSQEATEHGLKTKLFDIDGNTLESIYPASFEGKPQEIGSALSYAKRYALTALLGLIIEGEDDDGQQAQSSEKQSYKKSQVEIKWLSEQDFWTLLNQSNPDLIQKNVDFYSGSEKNGKVYKMKSSYRDQLNERIKSLRGES